MKNFKKIMSLLLALTLCLSFPVAASAAAYNGDDPREGFFGNTNNRQIIK